MKQREAFGRTIADRPAVRARVGETAVELAAAKALTFEAARAKQAGGGCDLETLAAKIAASRAATNATTMALELGIGRGYIEGLPIAQLHRDALLFRAGEGANGALVGLVGTRTLGRETSLT